MVKKSILNDAEKENIAAAIKRAEAQTSGEIFTVITRQSDHYTAAALTISLALTVLIAAVTYIVRPYYNVPAISLLEGAVFFLILGLLEMTSLTARLVPAVFKQRAAIRFAREQFLLHGLHHARDQVAILILISLYERRVELIADQGIASRETPERWAAITNDLTADLRSRPLAEAINVAVEACAGVLKTHFPSTAADENTVPDTVRIIGE